MSPRSLLAGCLATLVLSAPAADAATPVGFSSSNPIPSPGAFYVRGSNGYTLSVFADDRRPARPRVIVSATNRTGRVTVEAPADFGEEGIVADLGRYGQIDMEWQPSGVAEEGKIQCREFPPTTLWFAGGAYVGSFSFHGEDGFTDAEVQSVDGRQGWWRYESCGYTVSEGYPGPGILLDAERSSKGRGREAYRYFSLVQNKPGEKVSYGAGIGESHGRIDVYRAAYALGGRGSLRVGAGLDKAEVRPPAPFAGRGVFERIQRGRPGRWWGALEVDFPGRPDVSLAGGSWSASLVHGFREAHPGRSSTRPGTRPISLVGAGR
ncbi:MAG TPA: hypothetical protein VFN18_10645 [Solirubrobacterales bacterium]|nr:hypothetical protein [Solirubrobacterales bacterium]